MIHGLNDRKRKNDYQLTVKKLTPILSYSIRNQLVKSIRYKYLTKIN